MANLDPTKVAIYQRRGIFYMSRTINGVRIRRTLHTSDPDVAKERATVYAKAQMVSLSLDIESPLVYPPDQWFQMVTQAQPDKSSWLYRMFLNVKHRSRRRKRDFSLTFEQLRKIALRSAGRCEVTGTPFVIGRKGEGIEPFIPSLDRRDSKKGYHWSNCRLVCLAANLAMSKWGEPSFLVMLKNYSLTLSTRKNRSQIGT